jgi:hypothetical protein
MQPLPAEGAGLAVDMVLDVAGGEDPGHRGRSGVSLMPAMSQSR